MNFGGPLNIAHFKESARRGLSDYWSQLSAFQPNARLYLVSVVLSGAALGIFRLLFNFFVLSQGYDETLLGNLTTAANMTALLLALPMGYLADFLGRKRSLMLGSGLISVAIVVMVLAPSRWMFIGMNVLIGAAQSLTAVTMSPFLVENSSPKERVYLFSFSSGLQTASSFVGNSIGGRLPGWVGALRGVSATSTSAYGSALIIIAAAAAMAMIPLLFLHTPRMTADQRALFAPISYASQHSALLGKLILPSLITSIGAGMIMPFMNVFFRFKHQQPDPVIGSLFAWGALAMGIGLMIAPPLADRMGKIQLVVITQSLSIPFLAMLGFSPIFGWSAAAYLTRLALMNMSGPVYQTFVMDRVEPQARTTVASLVSMAGNFGWAFSPTISGILQVKYGFGPSYLITIILYVLSIWMYWNFFLRKPASTEALPYSRVELK
ncbi:MAG: MFS transporter [Anaerolineaceae bacterium]